LGDAFGEFHAKRLTFLLSHSFEIIQCLIYCLFKGSNHPFINAVAAGNQSTGYPCKNIDVQYALNTEFLLQLLQGLNVAGDERAVQLVGNLPSSFKAHCDISPASSQTRRNATFNSRLNRSELGADSQMD